MYEQKAHKMCSIGVVCVFTDDRQSNYEHLRQGKGCHAFSSFILMICCCACNRVQKEKPDHSGGDAFALTIGRMCKGIDNCSLESKRCYAFDHDHAQDVLCLVQSHADRRYR